MIRLERDVVAASSPTLVYTQHQPLCRRLKLNIVYQSFNTASRVGATLSLSLPTILATRMHTHFLYLLLIFRLIGFLSCETLITLNKLHLL